MKILGSINRGHIERLSIAQLDSGAISVRVELRDNTGRWTPTRKQLTFNDAAEILALVDTIR